MPLPRRPFNRVRRAILKALGRRFPAVLRLRQEEQRARLTRDLRRLQAIAAGRPEPAIRITCSGRRDGAGGQALSIISALAFADNHGCRYVHTAFQRIAHVEGDASTWSSRWETFFNFGHGETPVRTDADLVPLRRFIRFGRRDPRYVPGPHTVVLAQVFGYNQFSQYDIGRLKPRLRTKYFSADKSAIPVHRTDGAINVAIHVRRGDVREGFFRYMPDAPILATIAQLRATFDSLGRAVTFNVYSEGVPEQFEQYHKAGCGLHLSTDTFETFHNMVMADVLVAAPSAFSWTAALLSDGITLTPDLEWGCHAGWQTRAPDGSFDCRLFIDALTAKGI